MSLVRNNIRTNISFFHKDSYISFRIKKSSVNPIVIIAGLLFYDRHFFLSFFLGLVNKFARLIGLYIDNSVLVIYDYLILLVYLCTNSKLSNYKINQMLNFFFSLPTLSCVNDIPTSKTIVLLLIFFFSTFSLFTIFIKSLLLS